MTRFALPLILTLCASPALADRVSSQPSVDRFARALDLLDARAAQQYAGSARLLPPQGGKSAAVSPVSVVPPYAGRYRGPLLALAQRAARNHNVPADLFARLVQRESNWHADAVSHKGALGLAQLMPGTARALGVDPANATQNLSGGARYLRQQYDRFGSWSLALAAYNAGPEAVARHGGIPPYAETQAYVRAILGAP